MSLACLASLPVSAVIAQQPLVPLFKAATIQDVLIDGDGRVITVGSQGYVDATPVGRLVALRPDGSIDPAWSHAISGTLDRLLRDPSDGSVLAAGAVTAVNGEPRNGIARFAADGSLTPWQALFTGSQGASSVQHADVLPDGDIIAVAFSGGAGQRLFRIDGETGIATPSWSFTGGVVDLVALPDASVVVVGSLVDVGGVPVTGAARLSGPELQPANLLQSSPASISALGRDPVDGSWYVAGANAVQRFTSDGQPDPDWRITADGSIDRLVVDGARGVLASGGFSRIAGVERSRVARLRKDVAAVDTAWVPPATSGRARVLDVAADRVFAGGNLVSVQGGQVGMLVLSATDGQPVPAAQRRRFGVRGQAIESGHRAVGLADGGVVVTGPFSHSIDIVLPGIVRLDAGGAIRRDWAPSIGGQVQAAALARDGRLYLSGVLSRHGGLAERSVIRLDVATGTVDPAWRIPAQFGADDTFALDDQFIYTFTVPVPSPNGWEVVRWPLSGPAVQDPGWRAPVGSFAGVRNLVAPNAQGFLLFNQVFACCVDFDPPPPPGPPQPLVYRTRPGTAGASGFTSALGQGSSVERIRTDALGRTYLSGFLRLPGQTNMVFPRLLPDGTLDPGFQFSSPNQWPHGVMVVSRDGNFVYAALTDRSGQPWTIYRTVRFDARSGAIDLDWNSTLVDGWFLADITLAGDRVFVVSDSWTQTADYSLMTAAFLDAGPAAQFRDGFEAPPAAP